MEYIFVLQIKLQDYMMKGKTMLKLAKLFLAFTGITVLCVGCSEYLSGGAENLVFTEETAETINSVATVEFSEFKESDFTCTGLTFNDDNQTFWIADLEILQGESIEHMKPRLININASFSKVLNILNIPDNYLTGSFNLQGIAYDKKDQAIWLAIGSKMIEIDTSGNVIREIELNVYDKYQANGIAYDNEDDTIWVLCAYKYILHYDKLGLLLSAFPFNQEGQDQIVIREQKIYITVGNDYRGFNNYVYVVNKINGATIGIYRVKGSNAVEGICFKNSQIYIANDGFFHDDIIGKSYISVYEIQD